MDAPTSRPSFITPTLAVGGLDCLVGAASAGITHIVTVINGVPHSDPPPTPGLDLPALHRLLLDLADEEGADLLGAARAAVAWVRAARAAAARAGGAAVVLLVHCVAGVSRSAAVAAALLMADGTHPTSAAALAAVTAAHPPADPNPGFRTQLSLWEGECGVGGSSGAAETAPAARAWAAARLGEAMAAGAGPGADMAALLAALPSLPADAQAGRRGSGGAGPPQASPSTLYRCRACRRLVATSDHAVPLPDPPPHGPAFKGKARRPASGCAAHRPLPPPPRPFPLGSDGSSLFVQPLRWMFEGCDPGTPLPTAGKLACPGCAARLGAFNWAGGQSADGAWVVPAFQLHLARLDAFGAGQTAVPGAAGGGQAPGVRLPARLL